MQVLTTIPDLPTKAMYTLGAPITLISAMLREKNTAVRLQMFTAALSKATLLMKAASLLTAGDLKAISLVQTVTVQTFYKELLTAAE